MAFANKLGSVDAPFAASADLSAKQYFLVKLHTTEGQVAAAGAATDKIIGVLQNKPTAAGAAADVHTISQGGISKVAVDGNAAAIAIGDYITSDANGRGVKGTAAAGNFMVGTALQASTAATDTIAVLLGGVLKNSADA